MAQGKAYNQKQREMILKAIEPYLKLGYSLRMACILGGVKYDVIWRWQNKDEALSIKFKSWQNTINSKARANLEKAVNEGDISTSQYWLEKRDKDFMRKQEIKVSSENEEKKKDVADTILSLVKDEKTKKGSKPNIQKKR